MDLSVPYSVSSNPDEAYKNAQAQITPEYIAKFNVKADINYDEASKKIEASGKGFTLTLSFKDSETHADLKLSLLLKPLKGKILETIERKLSKHV